MKRNDNLRPAFGSRMIPEGKERTPVHRQSNLARHNEAAIWNKTSRKETQQIVMAAKRYDRRRRLAGSRNGPLGGVAVELVELLANLVDFRTGRLEPSIVTLMRLLKRSRSAVVGALKALRTHGFLDWIRRYVPTGNVGRGPQVRQTSNAYRLALPQRARQLLGWLGVAPPPPDDHSHAREMHATEMHEYQDRLPLEELPRFLHGDTPLAESLARLGALIKQRESAGQTESHPSFIVSQDK